MANYKLNVDQVGNGDASTAISDATPLPVVVSPSSSSAVAPTNSAQAAAADRKIFKATAGTLYGFSGYNGKTTAQFIQLHNSATLPSDAAVPAFNMIANPLANFSADFGQYGMSFDAGIVICNSATSETKTIGSADCQFFGRYK
jgi:hypothetical protein